MDKRVTAIIALAIACASFAGIIATDADAETASVTFEVGETTYSKALEVTGGQITLPTISDIGATVPAGQEFKGWVYTAEDKTTTTYAAGSSVASTLTKFVADLDPITYVVNFEVDGKVLEDATVKGVLDADLTVPAKPAKKGYIFLGWSLDGSTVLDLTGAKITASVTYKAVFQVDYKLTFDIDGSPVAGGTVSAPVIPEMKEKAGYEFVGWSTDGKTVIEDLSAYIKGVAADTVFYAVYNPVNHTVTFVANGEVVLPVQTVLHNGLVTEPKTIPTKDGCDFAGWVIRTVTTDAEGREVVTETPFDFATPITSDLTITASFTATPEPEKTGLDNPVVLSAVIIAVLIVGFVLAVLVLKKDVIKSKMAARLADAPKEGDKKA